jgi:uncharacterized protein (TIRG00374 family)
MVRKLIFVLIKLLVAAAAVFWLQRKVDVHNVLRVLRDADPAFVCGAFLISVLNLVNGGFRWNRLLDALRIRIPMGALTCIAQIGQFFAVFLPGTAGDDVTRFVYIARLAPGRVREACATVLLDRVIGLSCLFTLAFFCIPSNWSLLQGQASTRWTATAFSAVGGAVLLAGVLFFSLPAATLKRVVDVFEAPLKRFKIAVALAEMARTFADNRRTLAVVTFAALLTQSMICVIFYLAARAVGIDLPLLSWMSFVPVIVASGALPITFAGIGVREYLLLLFVGGAGAGIDQERILAASILILALAVAMALIGGLVYLVYRPVANVVEDAADQTCSL